MPINPTQNLTTAVLLASLSSVASAITNVETVRPGLPEQGLSGNIQLGIDGKSGNSSERNYQAGANLVIRKDKNLWFGFADYEYGTTQRVRDTNNALLHTRWVHLLTEKWSSEVFVQWQRDEFDNLESRTLAGAGGRYLALKNADMLERNLTANRQALTSDERRKLFKAAVMVAFADGAVVDEERDALSRIGALLDLEAETQGDLAQAAISEVRALTLSASGP